MDDLYIFKLTLSDHEMNLLDKMARRRGLTKNTAIRQAIRLYDRVTERVDRGEEMIFKRASTKYFMKVRKGRIDPET